MKPVKEVTAMVIDNGLFVETAVCLARTYKKVYYCVLGWPNAFPKMQEAWIGRGLEEIEVVDDPWQVYDQIDLWIFPDIYYGPMQVWLESQGKKVWGSRMGEEMELYRDDMKVTMKKLGLEVQPYVVLKGTDALREHLKKHKNKWVKINKFRGTAETFYSKDYKEVEPKLDEMEYRLGAFKKVIEFIVEDDLPDRVEVGIDCYTIDGDFPTKTLSGIEVKDKGYVGIFLDYKKLPAVIIDFNEKLKDTLRDYGYRGFYSTELRVNEDKQAVMIDLCARQGSPPGELYQEFYLNLAEIIWGGANGEVVDPKPIAKYGAEILLHSSWADQNWQPVDFPEKNRRNIKLRNATKIEGRYYVIPQECGLPEIGAAIGYGDTLEAAIKMACEMAESVSGYYIESYPDCLNKAQEEIDKLDDFGVNYFKES
jgi:hypothetical protein